MLLLWEVSFSQDNGEWKSHPMVFAKQPVLGELLPQQVEHVLGVPYMVFVLPVSRTGSEIL